MSDNSEDTKDVNKSTERRIYDMFYYPTIEDPGIEAYFFTKQEHTTDIVQYYKDMCEVYKVIPRKMFIEQINKEHINLQNAMIQSNDLKTMLKTLRDSTTIKSIDLSKNFISIDTCNIFEKFFSGNNVLSSINLAGCRLGPKGLKPLVNGLLNNQNLTELILTSNLLTDEGIELLTPIILNNPIRRYDLSKNGLTFKSGMILAKIINVNEEINEIDLSWNAIDTITGMRPFLIALRKNKSIVKLNLSWNGLVGPEIGLTLKKLIKFNKVLQYLDISNNRLKGALLEMSLAFRFAKSMQVIKFGNNPINVTDALVIMNNICIKRSSINVFDMEFICVTPKFMLENKKQSQLWNDIEIIYGDVIGDYTILGPDVKKIILKRALYVTKTTFKRDLRTVLFTLPDSYMKENLHYVDFFALILLQNIDFDHSLTTELRSIFKGKKKNSMDILGMVQYAKTLWPDFQIKPQEETKKVLKHKRKRKPQEETKKVLKHKSTRKQKRKI